MTTPPAQPGYLAKTGSIAVMPCTAHCSVRPPPKGNLKIIAGNGNMALAQEISTIMGVPLTDCLVGKFSDGEVRVEVREHVRGADVFIIQPTCAPVNDNLMEVLLLVDALKRASAERITLVLPYYGYARQDRKDRSRVPISAKLVADLFESSGVHRVVCMDLHAGQIQGFFNIPLDHLTAQQVLCDFYKDPKYANSVIVAPDAGGMDRARVFARRLNIPLAVIDKRRTAPGVAECLRVIGDVKEKHCIIVDDMIDTAGTLVQAVAALKREGSLGVSCCCTHAVLSGPAISRLAESDIDEIVVSNTIPLPQEKRIPKIIQLSVAPTLANAIFHVHNNESVAVVAGWLRDS